MTDTQNLEALRDPGDIARERFYSVNRAVDLLGMARERQKDNMPRVPKHSLVDFTAVPNDIWQNKATPQGPLLPQSAEVDAHGKKIEKDQVAKSAQSAIDAENASSADPSAPVLTRVEFETPEELLRQANDAVKAALESAPQEDIKL